MSLFCICLKDKSLLQGNTELDTMTSEAIPPLGKNAELGDSGKYQVKFFPAADHQTDPIGEQN